MKKYQKCIKCKRNRNGEKTTSGNYFCFKCAPKKSTEKESTTETINNNDRFKRKDQEYAKAIRLMMFNRYGSLTEK